MPLLVASAASEKLSCTGIPGELSQLLAKPSNVGCCMAIEVEKKATSSVISLFLQSHLNKSACSITQVN